ncbi:DUF5686 and carboxypeptidase-like regulatory domain-containing protein [Fulvivirga ligni]|uniref:DUF5686 and carboxypeptidase-like regulatory domain-containing protein n=1 Tax=Fulvivirga ligni TaxID=2904246 RepID=UPI001F3D8A95|nr:DUF5686 and carboxypeptidase-like regulatory domain-containing protein [Fulvivirga ligni]UII19069.1 DUF5686 and carboxypeptidase regulatory-like domain-containing protein [Fulvivirga ligni]
MNNRIILLKNLNNFVRGAGAVLALFFISFQAYSQSIAVTGKVTDANSGDPIPFANVVFKGTDIGTTTDFEGYYKLQTTKKVDSLSVSYIGYISKTKAVMGPTQRLDFQLEEDVVNLQEVVFIAGENPAFEIMRNVMANKDKNDKRSLAAYDYETYTKIEIDVDNITDKFKKRKIMQKITSVMDSVEHLAGEDGKPILPIFISESLSKYYYRSDPKLKHENILKTKITGVGIEDGTLVSQFIGSSFQEYNFYQNWLNIVSKDFVSPIADGWKLYYDYDLTDSAYRDNDFCYRLDFYPKSEQDLAFQGTMWITKDGYALKQIDATVPKTANLNYIEKIKIQQELEPTSAGPWIPVKNRVLLDIGEVTDKMAGVLAKFYTSNRKVNVNTPQELKFYAQPIKVEEDFNLNNGNDFWDSHRHEPLSSTELSVYKMIDTLKNIPVVKTYTEILKVAINGYKKVGKFDVGPYLSLYSNNTVEGHRFQIGAKTNIDFSDKWVLGARVAYGLGDERFKYQGFVERIIDRQKWTTVRAQYTRDIDQVGLAAEDLLGNYIFLAATRYGNLIRPYRYDQAKFSMQREVVKGFTPKLTLNYKTFDPLYNFEYYTGEGAEQSSHFETAEAIVEARYAKGELFVQNDNDRISLGTLKWPIFTMRYTRGFKGIMGSDFDYNKLGLNIYDDLRLGFFGTSSFTLTGEHIFETLPYPLLKAHIGNESLFYTTAAFNLMNYSEFVSDTYVSLKYNHYFQGFILNRIPLMRKLKWRLLATANVIYGQLSDDNKALIAETTSAGEEIEPINSFKKNTPYVEVGYGVENIFKILRVDFLHRLNYLDNPDVSKFGVKISFQFIL